MKPARVLLVDDHVVFRECLAGMIANDPDFEVVGQAGDGTEALIKARGLEPDLILMDVEMPGCDGLEATRQIKRELPSVIIVMLTGSDDKEALFEAIKSGAQGYLVKETSFQDVIELLRGALRGETAVTPALVTPVWEEFRRLCRQVPSVPDEDFVVLTRREYDVLSHVARGCTDREVAEALGVSLSTVRTHMGHVLGKLQVNNRYEAVRCARYMGLISRDRRMVHSA